MTAHDDAIAQIEALSRYLAEASAEGRLLGQMWEQQRQLLPGHQEWVNRALAEQREQNARAVAWWQSQRPEFPSAPSTPGGAG